MMRWVAAAILFAMLPAAAASASSRLDFNQGWLFRMTQGLPARPPAGPRPYHGRAVGERAATPGISVSFTTT